MSTLSFKFIFFVLIVFGLTTLMNNKLKKVIILLANILFLLSFGNLIHLVWVMLAVGYSYLIVKLSDKDKRICLWGIIPLVLSLVYFKYFGLWTNSNIIMPLGISFYTFKIISVLVDKYKAKIDYLNLIDYAVYVSFFPVISAGPINRYQAFVSDLNGACKKYKFIESGAMLCGFGLFQKLVFGDFLGIVANKVFAQQVTGLTTVFGLIVYSFYIYVDFDSYSNIAIGISRMLGFDIARNFKTPYLASSIMEFWDRWHISLSTWLQEYIYIPLGGNRKGFVRKSINIMIVFLVSGIWHGSTLVFIVWGLGHGIVNIVENIIKRYVPKKEYPVVVRGIGKVLGIMLNFTIVTFLWIFFRSASLNEAFMIISSLFTGNYTSVDYQLIGLTIRELYWVLVIFGVVIVTDMMRNKTDMIAWLQRRNFIIRWALYFVMIVIALVFGVYGPGYDAKAFIYAVF